MIFADDAQDLGLRRPAVLLHRPEQASNPGLSDPAAGEEHVETRTCQPGFL